MLLSSLLVVCGRANYTNLSRYGQTTERTYRRHFNAGIGLEAVNQQVIGANTAPDSIQILVVDCPFNEKSGRATPDLDYFYNGKRQQVERGLEWSVVVVVDLQQHTAYALSAKQTEAGLSARVKAAQTDGKGGGNRVDFYLGHLAYCQQYVPHRVNYVVADSFYSKRKWVDGVLKLDWHSIGKLRQDADLKYLYIGPRRPGPRRQRKYDGKVNPRQLEQKHFQLEATLDDGTQLWTAVVWSVSLARRIAKAALRKEVSLPDQPAPDVVSFSIASLKRRALIEPELSEAPRLRLSQSLTALKSVQTVDKR